MSNNNIHHLLLAIDAGASSIKIVASLAGDAECVTLTIEPYCREVTDNPPPNLKFDENSLWVKFNKVTYAIGNLAQVKYGCPLTIKPSKLDTVIPKVVGAIAVFQQKFKLPVEFDVSIVSVLPPGEFSWEEKFKANIGLAFRKAITTPAGVMKPKLQEITISPEGYGVMTWHRTIGIARKKDCAVIMMGFRNTSVIFSVKGELTRGRAEIRILLANSSNPYDCVGDIHDRSRITDDSGQFANSIRYVRNSATSLGIFILYGFQFYQFNHKLISANWY